MLERQNLRCPEALGTPAPGVLIPVLLSPSCT